MKLAPPFEFEEDLMPNMTPMIDVVFQLIIFFLAAAELSIGGQEEIELPWASEARPAERMDPDSITIDVKAVPEGAVFSVAGRGYSYEALREKLRTQIEVARLHGRPAPPIILRADYRVAYKRIQELMFDCAAMGIELFNFQATMQEE